MAFSTAAKLLNKILGKISEKILWVSEILLCRIALSVNLSKELYDI